MQEKWRFWIWQVSTFELFRLCSHVSGNLHLKNSACRQVVVFGPRGYMSFYIWNDIWVSFVLNTNKTSLAMDGQRFAYILQHALRGGSKISRPELYEWQGNKPA